MKQSKKLLSLIFALILALSLFSGCSGKESESKPTAPSKSAAKTTVPPTTQAATTDEVREKVTVKGSGKNSALSPSFTLYGKTYTLGKSTVGDLVKNGWVKDEKNWAKIKDNQKIPAHSVNIIAKYLTYGEEEDADGIFISFRNVTDKPCTPDKCALSKIELNGRYDTSFGKSKLSLFENKLDMVKCIDQPSFESALTGLVSKATRKTEGYFYSTYYKYHIKINNGTSDITVRTDSSTGRLRNISVALVLSADYKAN